MYFRSWFKVCLNMFSPLDRVESVRVFCYPFDFFFVNVSVYFKLIAPPISDIISSVLVNKGVFLQHEQAPTAPKLEGVCIFVDIKYIFYEPLYLANLTTSGPVFLSEMVKRHTRRPTHTFSSLMLYSNGY